MNIEAFADEAIDMSEKVIGGSVRQFYKDNYKECYDGARWKELDKATRKCIREAYNASMES